MSDDAFIGLGPNGLRLGFDLGHSRRPEYCQPVFTEVCDPRLVYLYRHHRIMPRPNVAYIEVEPPPYPTAYSYGICPPSQNAYYYNGPEAPANSETYNYNQRQYAPMQPSAQAYPDFEGAPDMPLPDNANAQVVASPADLAAAQLKGTQKTSDTASGADADVDLPLPDAPVAITNTGSAPTDQTAPQTAPKGQPDATPDADAEVDMPLPDAPAKPTKPNQADKPPVVDAKTNATDPKTATKTKQDDVPADQTPTESKKLTESVALLKQLDAEELKIKQMIREELAAEHLKAPTDVEKMLLTSTTANDLPPLPDVSVEAAKIRDKINHALSQHDDGNFDNEAEILRDLRMIKKHSDISTIYFDELRRKLDEDGPWHINCISAGTATITLNADGTLTASNGGLFGGHERTLTIDPATGKINRNGYHWFGRNSDDAKSTTVPADQ